MSGEHAGESVPSDLPEPVVEWLREQAAASGQSPDEFLRRLLTAHAAASDAQADAAPVTEARLEAVESAFDEDIQDVRERVVQVKRETDEKAPADHDHSDLSARLDRLADRVDAVEADVEDVDQRLAEGFENYEEVLEYLTETTDALQTRTDTLARATLALREEVTGLAAVRARREAVAEIARAANQQGVRSADCEACGSAVDVALLREPACPHCATPVTGVERKRGFFGSHTLLTGERPALEEGEPDLSDAFDELETDEDSEASEAPAAEGGP